MSKYKRKPPKRQLKNRILILCGGKTEEKFFKKFKKKFKNGLSNVIVKLTANKNCNPNFLVDEAISMQDNFDELWCVFNKDDYKDFDDAIRKISKYPKLNCVFQMK